MCVCMGVVVVVVVCNIVIVVVLPLRRPPLVEITLSG